MPRFEPFVGLRYDGDGLPLADVIAPPYDVVGPAERAALASRSNYNSIHVELPEGDEDQGLDRYQHAAALMKAWQQAGVLERDDASSFYVYRMTFTTGLGETRSTTGVIGALGLDGPGGSVLPHERTMPKPKGDRLELLRSCRANLSPIWGLSLTPGLAAACAEAIGTLPAPASATDDESVLHELWPVTDAALLERIGALVEKTPVVIADGHHRYETATFYQSERRAAGGDVAGPYDLVMALVVELSEHELFVRAIHRLLSGLPEGFDLAAAFDPYFEVLAGPAEPGRLGDEMPARGALGLITPGGNFFLVPRPRVEAEAEADLDSSRLDAALAGLPAHDLRYQHGLSNIDEAVRSGTAQAGVLLRPATVAQIADTAHSGRRMPPKTTFFHPKPRTGMVFRILDA